MRAFLEAVLAYTKADKIHVISHSMGVTIGRKIIKGGLANDIIHGGEYNLGKSLADRV